MRLPRARPVGLSAAGKYAMSEFHPDGLVLFNGGCRGESETQGWHAGQSRYAASTRPQPDTTSETLPRTKIHFHRLRIVVELRKELFLRVPFSSRGYRPDRKSLEYGRERSQNSDCALCSYIGIKLVRAPVATVHAIHLTLFLQPAPSSEGTI